MRLADIRVSVKEHPGFDNPKWLSDDSCDNSCLQTCIGNCSHDFVVFLYYLLFSFLITKFRVDYSQKKNEDASA